MPSAADYFSPVAFFITLRETLEAGIIIAVLLGFIVQIVPATPVDAGTPLEPAAGYETFPPPRQASALPPNDLRLATASDDEDDVDDAVDNDDAAAAAAPVPLRLGPEDRETVMRRMRWQIWTGALAGLSAAALIGGVFIWVLVTFAHDLWQDAENLWEGCFCALASVLILVMGLAFLRLPHARTKWRLKLLASFNASSASASGAASRDGATRRARYILFGLPFITVLREGLEGVVFLGGIALSAPPLSLLFGALAGLVTGAVLAYLLFASAHDLGLARFTTLSTALLFLIGAGLASRAAYSLERQYFIAGVGLAAAESGTGPGSYRVAGNIWKLPYGDPEPGNDDTAGWAQIANSVVGWNNIGTFWTVSTYNLYWAFIIFTLVRMKYNEGRTAVFGRLSKRGRERQRAARGAVDGVGEEEQGLLPAQSSGDVGRRDE